jgi:NAD(P)H dehydrogenase (quinone)
MGNLGSVLIVTAHPRRDSLTRQVADSFCTQLADAGLRIEAADLAAESFQAAMSEVDEPAWSNSGKEYSAAVRGEMARVRRNDATVMIFPIYWWSLPAQLKGWIDRVWNFGFAYGGSHFPHRRVWMIGIAGVTRGRYTQFGYENAMRTQLEVGILQYCGVPEGRLEILYGSLEGSDYRARIIAEAAALARNFLSDSTPSSGNTLGN